MSRGPQRYRLVWEFELQRPGDYAIVRALARQALNQIAEEPGIAINPDYLAIMKVDTDEIIPR